MLWKQYLRLLLRESFTSGGKVLLHPLLTLFPDRHDHLLGCDEEFIQPPAFVSFGDFSFVPALNTEHKQRKRSENAAAVCTVEAATAQADLPLEAVVLAACLPGWSSVAKCCSLQLQAIYPENSPAQRSPWDVHAPHSAALSFATGRVLNWHQSNRLPPAQMVR